jgi:hypothetical protein
VHPLISPRIMQKYFLFMVPLFPVWVPSQVPACGKSKQAQGSEEVLKGRRVSGSRGQYHFLDRTVLQQARVEDVIASNDVDDNELLVPRFPGRGIKNARCDSVRSVRGAFYFTYESGFMATYEITSSQCSRYELMNGLGNCPCCHATVPLSRPVRQSRPERRSESRNPTLVN